MNNDLSRVANGVLDTAAYFDGLFPPDVSSNINSKYYDCNTLGKSELCKKTFLFKAVHLNVQSLPSKCEDLALLLAYLCDIGISFDFILFCETFLTDNNSQLYTFPGYKLVQKSRKDKSRDGVAILINNNIRYKMRFIEVINGSKNKIVGEIYRVPNRDERKSVETFDTVINSIQRTYKHVII